MIDVIHIKSGKIWTDPSILAYPNIHPFLHSSERWNYIFTFPNIFEFRKFYGSMEMFRKSPDASWVLHRISWSEDDGHNPALHFVCRLLNIHTCLMFGLSFNSKNKSNIQRAVRSVCVR